MVIDPLSAIAKIGALRSARAIGNRLIYLVRDRNITTCITALVDGDDPQAEATELQISTIADTWIHLSYLVVAVNATGHSPSSSRAVHSTRIRCAS